MYTAHQLITFQNVLGATAVIWYFTAVYYLELKRQFRYPEYPGNSRYPLWRQRFKLYARLSAAAPDNVSDRGPEAQEVLQGFLRKVEAKNFTLIALWSIVLIGLFALTLTQSSWSDGRLVIAALAVWSAPFAARLVLGMTQVDQVTTHLVLTRSASDAAAAGMLQDQLIEDLCKKELAFRFSSFGFRALVVVLLLLTVAYAASMGDMTFAIW